MDRRELLRRGALVAGGTVAGAVGRPHVATATPAPPMFAGRHEDEHELTALTMTWRVVTDRKLVALTCDDGPTTTYTPALLATLREYGVRVTLYLVGSSVAKNPALVRAAAHDGHGLGNHTWSHVDLGRVDERRAYEQLHRTHEAIERAAGRPPTTLRPPFGRIGGPALLAAGRMGYPVVMWSMEMHERTATAEQNAAHAVSAVTPGTIFLAHDGGPGPHSVGIRALPAMIEGLRARGFEFVTVPELLAAGAVPRQRT